MKCTVCGVELKDTDKFCGICGTPNPDFGAVGERREAESAAGFFDGMGGANGISAADNINETERAEEAEVLTESAAENAGAVSSENYAEEALQTESEPTTEPTDKAQADLPPTEREEPQNETADQGVFPAQTNQAAPPRGDVRYGSAFAPPPYGPQKVGYGAADGKNSRGQKEKRVCSLSAVVFCIIVILILSAACGVLGGMYLRERNYRLGIGYGRSHTSYSCSDGIHGLYTEKYL
ncbi:MAG: zinc-ribbon domain-containing protein [Bacteroides sp.]|nr:zinc-ribbon domain-containing protein [Bacteroides sp.]